MRKLKFHLNPWFFRTLLAPVYPHRCMLCGKPLAGEKTAVSGLCTGCTMEMFGRRLDGGGSGGRVIPLCIKCGRPLISEDRECMYCREREYGFESNHSIFLYEGPVRDLIGFYKFRSRSRLVYLWAWFFADYLRRNIPGAVVVPVPGRKSSVRRRGWDQMYLLAKVLRKKYGIPVRHLLLRRGGASQKTLSYEGRMHNLKGHIRLKGHAGKNKVDIPDEVVLIDDIFTTGASLSECARVLRSSGASKVRALTIARAPH